MDIVEEQMGLPYQAIFLSFHVFDFLAYYLWLIFYVLHNIAYLERE